MVLEKLDATLKTGSSPLSVKTVSFTLKGNSAGSATTDGSGVASLLNVTIGQINAGSYSTGVAASFAGDSSFSASSATANLTVSKAVLTVTANPKSKVYGAGNPSLTYTITGFVNGDLASMVSGTAICNTTATPLSGVGGYPITCTQGSLSATNYTFSFVGGSFTVGPSTLTVTADPKSKVYGAGNPSLTYTITGFVNCDPSTVLSCVARLN